MNKTIIRLLLIYAFALSLIAIIIGGLNAFQNNNCYCNIPSNYHDTSKSNCIGAFNNTLLITKEICTQDENSSKIGLGFFCTGIITTIVIIIFVIIRGSTLLDD